MYFRLDKNTVTPELKRLASEVKKPRALYAAGAKEVKRGIIQHLRALEARGNVMGWPSQHFFARGPNSVEKNVGVARVDDRGAEITIADPRFEHRIEGGQVTAKRSKFLTIPLSAEAYRLSGKGTLRESAPGLICIKGQLFKPGKKGQAMVPLFRLARSVKHRPHPAEMPDQVKLGAMAGAAMTKAAQILLKAGT